MVARDNEVRDSLTKMMTTKADSGMSSIFHNFPENFSLRTAAFLLVSSIAVVLVLSVSIGLICKVQVIIHILYGSKRNVLICSTTPFFPSKLVFRPKSKLAD